MGKGTEVETLRYTNEESNVIGEEEEEEEGCEWGNADSWGKKDKSV